MAKVSILIPLYNSEKYVSATIESCLNQTYNDIEVIIVDDGSTDNSLEIVQGYAQKDSRVRVYSQPNGGGCKARNHAFEKSIGEYIVYLDADDIISEDKIEAQIEQLSDKPETYVSISQWDRFYNNLEDATFPNRSIYKDYPSGLALLEDLLTVDMLGLTCYMTHRQLIEKAGKWDETLRVNQDGEFFSRVLLHASQVKYSEKGRLYYRSADSNSISRVKVSEGKGQSLLRSYQLIMESIIRADCMTNRIRIGLVKNFQSVAYQYTSWPSVVEKSKELALSLSKESVSPMNGGNMFILGCRILGFWRMINIKQILSRWI